MNDKFREECGVIGIWGDPEAVLHASMGLTALQHRGQDSSGIAASDGCRITKICALGPVSNLVSNPQLKTLRGNLAIGHVRYATVGESNLLNAQPIFIDCRHGQLALCHNGQLINDAELKQELTAQGATWVTNSDSEVILQACHFSKRANLIEAISDAIDRVKGAFSLLMMTQDELIAARDPFGVRPLCLGRAGRAIILASETCALDALGADYLRDIQPGEIVIIGESGIRTVRRSAVGQRAHCIFEHVYFARADSAVFGENVGAIRLNIGRNLACQAGVDADVVVPVPDSGVWVALGFHEQSGVPLRMGLVRNSYVGRMFIEPHLRRQSYMPKLKLNVVRSVLEQKRVILIDDSIVRGETMRRVVEMVRRAGAKEVHVRIGGPPTIAPCFYGINTPTRTELIASGRSVEEVRQMVGADTLEYLSLQGLLDAVGPRAPHYCTACYTEDYRLHLRPAQRPACNSWPCIDPVAIPAGLTAVGACGPPRGDTSSETSV